MSVLLCRAYIVWQMHACFLCWFWQIILGLQSFESSCLEEELYKSRNELMNIIHFSAIVLHVWQHSLLRGGREIIVSYNAGVPKLLWVATHL